MFYWPSNIRKICSFGLLSLQIVAITTPVLGHVVSSQQFWNERSQNVFFIRGQNRNFLKVKVSKMHSSLYFIPFLVICHGMSLLYLLRKEKWKSSCDQYEKVLAKAKMTMCPMQLSIWILKIVTFFWDNLITCFGFRRSVAVNFEP